MPEEELNLFEFTACLVAKAGAGSAQVMRCNNAKPAIQSCLPNDGSDHLGGEPAAPDLSNLAHGAEQGSGLQVCRSDPIVDCRLHPFRYGHSSHETTLAYQIR
jgi:hypothetical protein